MKIVNYEEELGEIRYPEGFEEKLEGKELEEQMKCFRITEAGFYARTAYGQIEKEDLYQNSYALEEYSKFRGIVIKDKNNSRCFNRGLGAGTPGGRLSSRSKSMCLLRI